MSISDRFIATWAVRPPVGGVLFSSQAINRDLGQVTLTSAATVWTSPAMAGMERGVDAFAK